MLNSVVITTGDTSYTLGDIDIVFGTLTDVLGNALIGESLSIDTLTFKACPERYVDTPSGIDYLDFTPYVDTAIVYHGSELLGKYYIKAIRQSGSKFFEYECVSFVGALANSKHDGGIYQNSSIKTIIEDIVDPFPCAVDSQLASINVSGWLPIASKKDNLRQVLFACGANILKDADGNPEITFNLPASFSDISIRNTFEGLTKNKIIPATSIRLTEHSFAASQLPEYEILFDNSGVSSADHDRIEFAKPYHSLVGTGITIHSSGANYAVISGMGSLKGKPYVHNQRIIAQSTGKPGEENEISVENATLVSPLNSGTVIERLAAYYSQENEVSASILTTSERPCNLVKLHDRSLGAMLGYIKTAKRTFSRTIKSDIVITQDWTPGPFETSFTDYDLITSSGSFVIPEGVSRIRVILIGGGQGGAGGYNGKPGEDGLRGEETFGAPIQINGAPGDGGLPGSGGSCGKVYIKDLTVTPGTSFNVTIGQGGNGGLGGSNPTQGAAGGATTFGSYSSDSGVPASVINAFTGDIYSEAGDVGVAGGRGMLINGTKTTVTYKGITYESGDYGESWNRTVERIYFYAISGNGGGPAAGGNGSDGTDGRAQGTNPHNAIGGNGGSGASAITPDPATGIGKGGTGGNGGGGGGGGGSSYYQRMVESSTEQPYYSQVPGAGGFGGNGSPGGKGGPGAVLIYH